MYGEQSFCHFENEMINSQEISLLQVIKFVIMGVGREGREG